MQARRKKGTTEERKQQQNYKLADIYPNKNQIINWQT